MRKGWTQRKIHENAWGKHFTRWYIKSPDGNFYNIYRSCDFETIYMMTDANDCHKSKNIGKTWREAMNVIYDIEKSGSYSKELSNAIMNKEECKTLFASEKKSHSYSWA